MKDCYMNSVEDMGYDRHPAAMRKAVDRMDESMGERYHEAKEHPKEYREDMRRMRESVGMRERMIGNR